jgi:hypothetical protein
VFSAEWLMLREPVDVAARCADLTRAVADTLDPRLPLRAVDLAAGTGANVRYVADHVHRAQEWLIVDNDPIHLSHVAARMSAWALARGNEVACAFETRQADLRTLDDPAIFAGRTLITASAFLDLVSEPWIRALAARCREANAAALLALTYDGRMSCSPPEPEDERIRALVNVHQRTDKGFGPALGPGAAGAAAFHFADVGYRIRRAPSDWRLRADSSALQRELIDGWAQAATALAPSEAESILSWRTRRLEHVEQQRSELMVGHEDLGAWPF